MTTTDTPTDDAGADLEPGNVLATSGKIAPAVTPEDRLIAALGPEPDVSELPPDEAEQALAAWREAWDLRDLEDADWAARKLQQVRARQGEIDKVARTRIAQIQEWQARENARHEPDLAYFAGRLETFHRFRRAEDEKHNKTVELPCGVTLRSQAGKLKVNVTDEAELVAWLEQHCASAIIFPPATVDKNEVSRRLGAKAQAEKAAGSYPAVDSDGVVVPGVEIVRGEVSYTIS